MEEVSVTEFRRSLAAYADRIQLDGERFLVTSHGRPAFLAVPLGDAGAGGLMVTEAEREVLQRVLARWLAASS